MKKLLLFAAVASAMMTSCTKDEPVAQPTSGFLSISNVATLGMETRASVYGSSIGLVLPESGDFPAVAAQELTSPWTIATPIPVGATARALAVWGPYSIAPTAGTSFTLTSQKYAVAEDLVYQKTSASAASPAVSLLLGHAYAQVSLIFETDANYLDDAIIKSVTLKAAPETATFNILSGEAGIPNTTVDVKLVENGVAAYSTPYSALVVPAESGVAMTLDCAIDGLTFTDKYLGIGTLAAGNNYTVTVKLKGTLMTISKVEVSDWNDVPSDLPLN